MGRTGASDVLPCAADKNSYSSTYLPAFMSHLCLNRRPVNQDDCKTRGLALAARCVVASLLFFRVNIYRGAIILSAGLGRNFGRRCSHRVASKPSTECGTPRSKYRGRVCQTFRLEIYEDVAVCFMEESRCGREKSYI